MSEVRRTDEQTPLCPGCESRMRLRSVGPQGDSVQYVFVCASCDTQLLMLKPVSAPGRTVTAQEPPSGETEN